MASPTFDPTAASAYRDASPRRKHHDPDPPPRGWPVPQTGGSSPSLGGKTPGQRRKALRNLLIAYGHHKLGLSGRELGRMFGMSHAGIEKILAKIRGNRRAPD